jgi:hypothetical protein
MNPRLAKEFRPLLFPWCVCALAGFGHLAGQVSHSGVAQFAVAVAAFALFTGCLILAAIPFGSEFQQRTWSLLLGQPVERTRLWKEKFLAATVAVLALVAVHGLMVVALGKKLPFEDMLPCVGFVVATICSAGFCALAARSVIGGMAFAVGWQFLVFAGVSGITYLGFKVLGREPITNEWPILAAYIGVGMAYSTFTLWLGWRTFAKLEVRDAAASANLALPGWMAPKKMTTLFRCQPTGNLRNLIRKEVGLQKPIFTIAAFLVACWIVTFLLLLLEPSGHKLYEGVLNGLTAVHIAIITLLAGCVAIGDERSLGLAAWHLTLPASVRRQWFVKLLVTVATIVLVGIILPLFLASLTLVKARVGLVALNNGEIQGVATVLGVMLIVGTLSFWCALLVENTVRAALATILAVIGIGTCAQLAAWVSLVYFRSGLQTSLITSLIAHFQLPPDYFLAHLTPILCCFGIVIMVVIFVALVQSLAQFRRAQRQGHVLLKYSLILAAVVFFGSFWFADLVNSIERQYRSSLTTEVTKAAHSLPQFETRLQPGTNAVVTPQELAQTGELSDQTKTWLRNSKITLALTPVTAPGHSTRTKQAFFQITVIFPNGREATFRSFPETRHSNSQPSEKKP